LDAIAKNRRVVGMKFHWMRKRLAKQRTVDPAGMPASEEPAPPASEEAAPQEEDGDR
jgi:hypothetical protein